MFQAYLQLTVLLVEEGVVEGIVAILVLEDTAHDLVEEVPSGSSKVAVLAFLKLFVNMIL